MKENKTITKILRELEEHNKAGLLRLKDLDAIPDYSVSFSGERETRRTVVGHTVTLVLYKTYDEGNKKLSIIPS